MTGSSGHPVLRSASGRIAGALEYWIPAFAGMTPKVWRWPTTKFRRKFGEFLHQAQREPVEIMRHGRRELVLMSAEHHDWLAAAAKRTHRTVDSPQVVIDAVERSESL